MIGKFLSLFRSITFTTEQQQLKTGQFEMPKTRKQELFVLFTILVQKIILVRLLVLVHENITDRQTDDIIMRAIQLAKMIKKSE